MFPVQEVGLKNKSGICFPDLPHRTFQEVKKSVFVKLRK